MTPGGKYEQSVLKQSVKIERLGTYILTNTVITTDENSLSVKILDESHIFKSSSFQYDHNVERLFFQPPFISFTDVLNGPIGRRVSVQGLVVSKSKVLGVEHPRIDVVLSTVDDHVNMQITIKLWEDKKELNKLIGQGQLVSVYSVRTEIFRNVKHLSSTHDTQIYIFTISKFQYDEEVVEQFFTPPVMSIDKILRSTPGLSE